MSEVKPMKMCSCHRSKTYPICDDTHKIKKTQSPMEQLISSEIESNND
jgi:CDGSH-type Zn-finger protein